MKKGWILAGLAVACGMGAQAADFINLDFEDYAGTGNELLPGWERSANTYLWPLFDGLPLASAGLGLGSSNTTAWSGKYSAFFSTGQYSVWDETYGYISICCGAPEIWQTATVPSAATHVRYVASPSTIKNESELRMQGWLGGSDLSAGTPEAMPNGSLRYATDIQSLAGQEAMLKFGCAGSDDPFNPGTHHWLDQIEFLDAEGTVIWPPPRPEPDPVVYLEDFHAATFNTSLWEVVATIGTTNAHYISNERLITRIYMHAAPFETFYRYRSVFHGDWDVRMDFYLFLGSPGAANPGILGMALGAEFGPDRTSTANVGQMTAIADRNRFFGVDWGQGPTNEMATTNQTGVFRLTRTGGEVAGYVWDAGSNAWQIVGTADGYTDDVARVGLKVWCTGIYGGKGADTYSDNLAMSKGRTSLDGMAIKTFGLDESGAPTVAWDSVGIPQSNRYVVTRATSLVGSAWTQLSGAIADSGGETNWTGANPGMGPFYYRIESVPGP
jgi:hypothetical protein